MRVAIIIPRLEQLGPVKVIETLVNALIDFKELSIKVFYLDKTIDQSIKMTVPVEHLDCGKFQFNEFDIVHTNGLRPDLFAFLNRKKIKYHITTIHNFVFEDLASTYNRLTSFIFGNIWLLLWKRADKLVCVSGTMKKYHSNWFSSSNMNVINNGIVETDNSLVPDNDIMKAINRFHSKGLKVIGFAGTLTKIKGIDQAIRLLSVTEKYAFIILGDGREKYKLQQLTNNLDVSDRCLLCGFRSNAVIYFKYFDYFIMSSRSEGFGLALIEAVQQKVPVICSDIEIFKELFNEEEITFFKLDDINSLSESLNVSAVKGKLKAELAYKRYLTNYTAAIMAKSYYDLYKSASLNTVIS